MSNNTVATMHHVQVGHPKKKRKRSKHKDEPIVKDGKVSRKGRTITCQFCGNTGQNKATCKGQGRKATTAILIPQNMSAESDNGKFLMVDEEDLTFKKLAPMAEEIIMLSEGLCDGCCWDGRQGVWGGGYLRDYVRVVAGTDDEDSDSELLIPTGLMSPRMKKGKKDKVSQEHVYEEEVLLNNNIGKQNGDLVEMPSEEVEQGISCA
uniref:Uncharacterized protein n=1 Tax=Tanacetum cinerariifolium TaxID=118510 RepID=A0A6L2P050_TANCI|nr:hypothetical protein [Tanacetum cinerariifolium]